MQHPGKPHIFHSDESGSSSRRGFSRFSWRRPSCFSPSLCLAVVAGLASLLALIFVCLFVAASRRQLVGDFKEICLTEPDCLSVSATAARRMNVSAQPCADFFAYACGGYGSRADSDAGVAGNVLAEMELGAKRRLARSLRSGGSGDVASWERKLRKFYARCEENFDTPSFDGENPLLVAMRAAGIGEFLLNSSRPATAGSGGLGVSGAFRVVSGRFYAHSLFATRAIYSDYLHRRGGDNRYAIWIGMNSRSDAMYIRQDKEIYRSLIKDVTSMLLRDAAVTNQTTRVEIFASDVLYIEEQLLQIYEDILLNARASDLDVDHPANLVRVSDLTERMSSHIDFRAYLSEIYESGMAIRNDTQVLVTGWHYVDRLKSLFDRMRSNSSAEFNRKIENYLTWTLTAFFQWDLSGEYRLRFTAYRRIIWPSNGLAADGGATDCLETVRWGMNQALSALFVRDHFGPADRDRASALFEQMRQAVKDGIDRIAWMDAGTKRRAKQRVADIVEKSGYPDEAWDDGYLDAEFQSIDPSKDSYFNLIVSCINYWKSLQSRLLTRSYNPRDFQHWGQLWEASLDYRPYDRELLAQAGALQSPLFPPAALPQLLAYSGAGSMMAHEILQSFDITSHVYEAQRMSGWWSDATISEYHKRTSCILDLFKSERSAHQKQLQSNWTVREISAIRFARAQFEERRLQGAQVDKRLPLLDLTEDQVFFVFYMQKFCHRRGANSLVRRAGKGADWRRGLGGEFQDAGSSFEFADALIPRQSLANAVLFSAPGFAQAFGCSQGSPMAPSCSLY